MTFRPDPYLCPFCDAPFARLVGAYQDYACGASVVMSRLVVVTDCRQKVPERDDYLELSSRHPWKHITEWLREHPLKGSQCMC